MAPSEPWTIGRLLHWTADYLKQHGSENPRLDAEVLLAFAARCERIELYTRFNEPAEESLRAAFRQLVKQRAEGTPVAYLVGHREFYSMDFEVTPDVLIPRPETELLVIEVLDLLKQPPLAGHPVDVLDVGTGSGVIAICLARHASQCRVTAVDVSREALAVAERNVQRHQVQDRVRLVHSDLLESLPETQSFDVIVSNPPYISAAEFEALPSEIKDREPRVALLGGPEGMDVIERLIEQAFPRLKDRGALLMEISPMLEPAIRRRFAEDSRWTDLRIKRDLAGLSRVARVLKQG